MKFSLALALAAFLGFGAVSTVFAQDAMGGITNWTAPITADFCWREDDAA